jgi:MoxR-like ATPase
MAEILTYTGNALQTKDKKLGLEAYRPSVELIEAVNLALLLEQPLLLMGEPGCGKTRLAEAVAAELHGDKWKDHYFRWDIKSSSKAKEGIYQYDALRRLYDANSNNKDAIAAKNYKTDGKLAEALTKSQNGELPNILLIDEVDKADIDFPNDLLLEIEKGEFFIPELNETVVGKSKVLVFITSNRERELPPAFLRRCLYHYITFPTLSELTGIVMAKFDRKEEDVIVQNAVKLFLDIRQEIDLKFAETDKKPATSELLEWFKVIDHYDELRKKVNINTNEKAFLETIETYMGGKMPIKIPFKQVLLKTFESNRLFETVNN